MNRVDQLKEWLSAAQTTITRLEAENARLVDELRRSNYETLRAENAEARAVAAEEKLAEAVKLLERAWLATDTCSPTHKDIEAFTASLKLQPQEGGV